MAQQITLLGVGDTLVDRYLLVDELGRGSYGVVWRAQQLGSGQDVAIKTLLPQAFLDPEIPERFDREIQLVSRLNHPNIVALHDHGHHTGLLYMAIEFIEGRSLGDLIRDDTPLPAAQVIVLMRQILGALDHAHSMGIVHRDLKPENILLQQPDPSIGRHGETAKVLDFGIAKLIRSARDGAEFKTLTQSGHVLGTPHYMSPEQIVGDHIDYRTDLYAIGIILYELLTGVHPFDAPNSTAVMVRHLRDDPAPLPPPLNTSRWAHIIRNVLTKQPEDRYPSAQAFLAAIEQAEPFTTAALKPAKAPEGRSGLTAPSSRPLAAAGVEISDPDMTRELELAVESSRHYLDGVDPDEQTKRLDLEAVQTGMWTPPSSVIEAATTLVEPLRLDHSAQRRVPSQDSADALRITPPSRAAHHTTPLPALPARPPQRPSALRFVVPVLAILLILAAAALYIQQRRLQEAEDASLNKPAVVIAPPTAPQPTRPATLDPEDGDKTPDPAMAAPDAGEDKPAEPTPERTRPERTRPERTRPERTRPDKNIEKPEPKTTVALKITSNPQGARVVLDGKPIGDTPLTHEVPRDAAVQIKFSLYGYEDRTVRVTPSQQSAAHVQFAPKLQLIQ
jgi:serine/threonine protein kinase